MQYHGAEVRVADVLASLADLSDGVDEDLLTLKLTIEKLLAKDPVFKKWWQEYEKAQQKIYELNKRISGLQNWKSGNLPAKTKNWVFLQVQILLRKISKRLEEEMPDDRGRNCIR